MGKCLVSWKTKKQTIVSKLSAEAEYWVIASIASELLWLSYVLKDFRIKLSNPIPLYCDNKSTIHMMENPVYHENTKHNNIDCHFSRHHYKTSFLKPVYVESAKQVTDIFTKGLGPS